VVITAAVTALLALVAPIAPARGESGTPYVPLVHVSGWYVTGNGPLPQPVKQIRYADPAADVAFALPAGSWVQVYFANSVCRVDRGPTVASTALHSGTCHGHGPH
jgi:hypothetical protein